MYIKKLQELARRLQEPGKTGQIAEEQFLSHARRRHLGALDVLPELGLPTQEYLVFVYNHYCSHTSISARQVAHEFQLLKDHHALQEISRLRDKGGKRSDPLYTQLKDRGLQFLDAYLKAERELGLDKSNRREMERQLHDLMKTAASSYLKYLQLRSHGMKDTLARQTVGLQDDVYYRIALYTFMLQK